MSDKAMRAANTDPELALNLHALEDNALATVAGGADTQDESSSPELHVQEAEKAQSTLTKLG